MNEAQVKKALNELANYNSGQGGIAGALGAPLPQKQTAAAYLDWQIQRLRERLAQRQCLRALVENASEDEQQALLDLVVSEREWRV